MIQLQRDKASFLLFSPKEYPLILKSSVFKSNIWNVSVYLSQMLVSVTDVSSLKVSQAKKVHLHWSI